MACEARSGSFDTRVSAPQRGKKQKCARRRIGVRGHTGVVAPATVIVLGDEKRVSCPLERLPLYCRECEFRGDEAGWPVAPFACQGEEIVPEAIGTLTFKEERNTTLEDVRKVIKASWRGLGSRPLKRTSRPWWAVKQSL
jgi:hypothetical protein